MLTRSFQRQILPRLAPRCLGPVGARCFAGPINHPMIDSDFNPPSSQTPLYVNEFMQKTPAEYAEDAKNAVPHPVVHDPGQLIQSDAGDPHNTYGMAEYNHFHYDITREPTFPRKPDLSKGELAAGAQVVRTDVWVDPKEPAIIIDCQVLSRKFPPCRVFRECASP